jgi:hypothetical protein
MNKKQLKNKDLKNFKRQLKNLKKSFNERLDKVINYLNEYMEVNNE